MKNLRNYLFCLSFLIFSFLYNAYTQNNFDPILINRLQQELDLSLKNYNDVGASAAVISARKGTWLGTSGYSNPVTKDTITSEMLFGIGGITESYTAAMMIKLLAEGTNNNLYDTIQYNWILDYPNLWTNSLLTIHSLIHHSSSLFDYTEHPLFKQSCYSDSSRVWTPHEILTNFLNPPYSTWAIRFSDTDFLLAGMIIEQETGTSVSHELHNDFLDPYNLNHTFLEVEDTVVGDLAHPWMDIDGDMILDDLYPMPRTSRYSMAWTSGGIIATAEDVANWAGYLYRGEYFSHQYLIQMVSFTPVNFPPINGYGLGTCRFTIEGRNFWGYIGKIDGFSSAMYYLPTDSISFVVLMNSYTGHASQIVENLIQVYLNFITSVDQKKCGSEKINFQLHPNYPNPFNPSTTIAFDLPKASQVTLKILNVLAEEVETLVSDFLFSGSYEYQWDAGNMASGVYLYKLEAEEYVEIRKMILMR
ncbi:MAG: serine hydrolase [Calditrichaeota bacterium]|nr:serine hydrolase [Calditrichota bacterium]